MINNCLTYLNPFAVFPQPDSSPGQYSAWKKPSDLQDSYLKLAEGEPQTEIGTSNFFIDGIKHAIAFIPSKTAGLAGQDTSTQVSPETIQKVEEYLKRNDLDHIKVSVNSYNPLMVWQRTFTNPRLMMITKLFSGSLNALAQTLLPQRLIGGSLNVYDQYTDMVTLNNNDLSMALFACAQAKATAMRKNPILYNTAKDFLPTATPVGNLYASLDVIKYLKEYGSPEEVEKAIKLQSASTGVAFGVDAFQSVTTIGVLVKKVLFISNALTCYNNGPAQELTKRLQSRFPYSYADVMKDYTQSPFSTCVDMEWTNLAIELQGHSSESLLYKHAAKIAFLAVCGLAGYLYGTYKVADLQKEESIPAVSGTKAKPDCAV
jgi:hypothetical protein